MLKMTSIHQQMRPPNFGPPIEQQHIASSSENQQIESVFSRSSPLPSIDVVFNKSILGSVYRYPTIGDGSCAFHALLGTEDSNGKYRTDAGKERAIFAVEIRKQYDAGELSLQIKNEMKDIFLHFDRAPEEMKFNPSIQSEWQSQLELYNDILNDPTSNSDVKQEILSSIVDRFINDAIAPYLDHLVNTESSVTPNELMALAETKNKTVHLFTKMRNEGQFGVDVSGRAEKFNQGASDPINIFLSDTGYHYERARYQHFQ
jgi:hypothetical protein